MRQYTLFITMLFPLTGLPLGLQGLYKDYKNWHSYVFCITLFFSALAYTHTPTTDSDLVRYFDYIYSISNLSLTETMSFSAYSGGVQSLFGFVMMSWIIGQIGDPHLIAAITVFVIYYVSLKITCQIGEDYKISINKIIIHIIFLILIINFYAVTNNIRNVFSFSLITLAVFRECYENKKNILTYFLYLFPLFVHPSSLVLLTVRIFIGFSYRIKVFFSFCLLCSYFLVGIIYNYNFLSFIENPITRVLNLIIIKSYNYFYDTTSEFGLDVAASPSEFLFKILYVGITVILASYALIILKKIEKKKELGILIISKIISFEMFLCFLTIACVPMMRPEYWRFAAISLICSAPVFLFCDNYWKNRFYTRFFLLVRFLFALACFTLWLRNLIRYSDLSEMIVNSIHASPIIVFIIDISNNLLY